MRTSEYFRMYFPDSIILGVKRLNSLFSQHHLSRITILVIFLLYAVLAPFMTFVIRIVSPDIYWHAAALVKFIDAGSFPVPPAYPFVLWLLSGFGNSLRPFLIGANVVLPLFILLQVYLVYIFLIKNLSEEKASSYIFLAVSFFLMAPVYFGYETFYIGRIALNVWHNPTYIAMAPFAIALFIITPRFIDEPSANYGKIMILGMITLMFKPSFLFAWIPAVFMYGLLMKSVSYKYLLKLALPLFSLGLLILLQYYFIYFQGLWENIAILNGEKRSVDIGLSNAWSHFLEKGNISLFQSLVSSFLFPLVFLASYGKSGAINEYTRFSLFVLFFGLIFILFFFEGGNYSEHGNFFWTGYAANLMFFLACFLNYIQIQQKRRFREIKSYLVAGVFMMHVLSGIGYMFYIMINGSYL
jgi:hypothetical protein